MKILLSAYACEPGKGSEPGVGWNWAIELAKLGHEVWVLTRANNQPRIEQELAGQCFGNLHFVYYDLPVWIRKLKKKGPFVQLYYAFWQWGAYRKARIIHEREKFELVHHLTFGVFRQASFMGRLGIPFIFGPVGGGERAPWPLRYRYSLKGHLADVCRDVLNWLANWDPVLDETLTLATTILVKTPQTAMAIPDKYQHKIRELIEIGIEANHAPEPLRERNAKGFRILYAGRLLYWKGMQFGLDAFAILLKNCPDATLTLVGTGPDEHRWRAQCRALGIESRVDWLGWVDKAELGRIYQAHDVFLFPSLHDSSGNVVLEALSNGLPVVCLDLGGPAMMVDDSCGRVIETTGKSPEQVVDALSNTLLDLENNREMLAALSQGTAHRASRFTWTGRVQEIYKERV